MGAFDAKVDAAYNSIRRALKNQPNVDVTVKKAGYDAETDTATNPVKTTVRTFALLGAPETMTQQTFQSQFAPGDRRESQVRKLTLPGKGLPLLEEGHEITVTVLRGADAGVWTLLGFSTLNPDGGAVILYNGTIHR